MFQTSVLASGSRGNSIFVRSRDTGIILDAGVSMKRIFNALDDLEQPHSIIKAVIVSHEHTDHARSAGALCRKLKIPLFISADTYSYSAHKLGKVDDYLQYFESGTDFMIGNILVRPFYSSHDAADSNNFCFEYDERKLGVAIDLGFAHRLTLQKLQGSNTLILESNHDHEMLINGPYEWQLKQRVSSNLGHLSNDEAIGLISQVMHEGLKNVVLAHLSEQNNTPELAYSSMKSYLESIRSDAKLMVASQDFHTPLIDI